MKGDWAFYAFNRGLVSRLALARTDLKRTSVSAAIQENWSPRALGPMMLRPGMGYVTAPFTDNETRIIPFIFAVDDIALLELCAFRMRVLVDDVVVSRSAVTASITNGTFTSNLTGWTDADEAGATSAFETGGYMGLTGTGPNAAVRYQLVTLVESGVQHGLRVRVTKGKLQIRVGSTVGGAEYIAETTLGVGEHSLTFTPTTNFYLQFSSRTTNLVLLDSVSFDPAGALELLAPWGTSDAFQNLRYQQSGDVIFVATKDLKQYQIERRSNDSWSIVEYQTEDGPFRVENVTPTTLTPSGLTGAISITASAPVFTSGNTGGLFRITSQGQTVTDSFSSANDFSNAITVTGVGEGRRFGIVISGTFVATLTLQRSFDEGSSWQDVTTYTAPANTTYNDTLDNQIVQYRIGVKTGDYTSGTATVSLVYSSGNIVGVVRIASFASETLVTADVLTDLGGTTATPLWAEGAWSNRRGYPSSVVIHDGRLFWAGKDRVWGSVTDAFTSFDAEFEGDAGPINRSIGFGPVDVIYWLLSMDRLMAGTGASELTFRSSALDEPLTPTNFTPKETSTQGSAAVQALKVDGAAILVQRCGSRLYRMAFDAVQNNYSPEDMTVFVPEVCSAGVVRMAVQRQPDTRVHCVLADGTVAVLVFDKAENLICWWKHVTDGDIEDVAVLPGTTEDRVYYVVNRAFNGGGDNYTIEKLALESEAHSAAINKMADSFVYAAGASTTITGLDHLEGRSVVAWGNGKYQGAATVSGGSITLSESCTNRCAGLPYQARFKSAKLAYVVDPGSVGMTQRKRINAIAPLMIDTHATGLRFGPDFDTLSYMPEVERGAVIDPDSVWDEYDADSTPFQGKWDTDSRLCLVADAPKACTLLGVVIDMTSHQRG